MQAEKEPNQSKEKEYGEDGHSEKQLDLDAEIAAGEWTNLKNFKTYQQRSRQGKIIAMHKAVSNRLQQLDKLYYPLVLKYPQKALKLLQELKQLRTMQEYLLQCLVWEEKNELTSDLVPAELWELIS